MHHLVSLGFLGLGTVLIYLSRYLDQETANWPFWSSS